MNTILVRAEKEFNILEKTVKKPIISPFKEEILTLVKKFGESGQSGASAPMVGGAISQAIKELLLQNPICPITGIDDEWNDCIEIGDRKTYQNKRLSSVFKKGKNGKPYYLNAIVFQGEKEYDTFTSSNVRLKNGGLVSSRQYIKLPFKPKTFYIDVISHRFDQDRKTGKLTPNPNGDWWEHDIKDESQLKEVFEYYNEFKPES